MLKMKPYYRAKCVEHLYAAGVSAALVMDKRSKGKYMGWYYEQSANRYWMVRMFKDRSGHEFMISRPFIGTDEINSNIPNNKTCIVC